MPHRAEADKSKLHCTSSVARRELQDFSCSRNRQVEAGILLPNSMAAMAWNCAVLGKPQVRRPTCVFAHPEKPITNKPLRADGGVGTRLD
jgi:hypothetical protein